MELLEFNFDHGSVAAVETLEEIMCSYNERRPPMRFPVDKALELFLTLVWSSDLKIYKSEYAFDHDIRGNADAMKVYQQLVPHTRWKTYTTGITECIRINALWQLKDCGEPFYNEYVFYPQAKNMLHCGNMNLHEYLMAGGLEDGGYNLIIFPYPYFSENGLNSYYKFETSPLARQIIQKYRDEWQKDYFAAVRKASESDKSIFPQID